MLLRNAAAEEREAVDRAAGDRWACQARRGRPFSTVETMHEHTVQVSTASGVVEGFARDGVHRWRSIPYATPPVGPLRFRAPKPVKPWQGVKGCHRYTDCAPQHRAYTMTGVGRYQPMSEDCLTSTSSPPAGRGLR